VVLQIVEYVDGVVSIIYDINRGNMRNITAKILYLTVGTVFLM